MKKVRKRLSYANVMSTIAVFLILGGATALAAQKVGTNQLKAGAVKTGKIARGAVNNSKIANLAVTTSKLAADAVTGGKVNESTLGEVPSAKNATTLDGIGATAFSRQANSSISSNALVEAGTARTVNITAPQNGYLLAIASGDMINEGSTRTYSDCLLNLDGADLAASHRRIYTSEEVPRSVCATNTIVPVGAGMHRVSFNFQVVGDNSKVESAELDVVFIPFAG